MMQMYLQKVISKKMLEKNYFYWHPATEKSRIRIQKSVVQILDPDPYHNTAWKEAVSWQKQ